MIGEPIRIKFMGPPKSGRTTLIKALMTGLAAEHIDYTYRLLGDHEMAIEILPNRKPKRPSWWKGPDTDKDVSVREKT